MIDVAILEASHWHVPLYLDALQAPNINVVAVSDNASSRGLEIAERFKSAFYKDYRGLLEHEKIDFAFTFGRHCDMAKIAKALIDRNIAFAIEKPCGINAAEVNQLSELAHEKKLFVSIPFIFRFSQLLQHLERLKKSANTNWNHLSFRFIAGPLDRYINANCSWMLEKKLAAGGCSINLAVHFIDLSMRLFGENFTSVSARMIESEGAADVEVFSVLTLVTRSGRVCCLETGYTYPAGSSEQREFSFTLASDKHYVRSHDAGIRVIPHDGTEPQIVSLALETDDYYSVFVNHTLDEYQRNQNPSAGLADMVRVMKVIDSAYESSSRDGVSIKCL